MAMNEKSGVHKFRRLGPKIAITTSFEQSGEKDQIIYLNTPNPTA